MSLTAYIEELSEKVSWSAPSGNLIDIPLASLNMLKGNNEYTPSDAILESVAYGKYAASNFSLEDNLKLWAYFKDSNSRYIFSVLLGTVSYVRPLLPKRLKLRTVRTLRESIYVPGTEQNKFVLTELNDLLTRFNPAVDVLQAYCVVTNKSFRETLSLLVPKSEFTITKEEKLFANEELDDRLKEQINKYYTLQE